MDVDTLIEALGNSAVWEERRDAAEKLGELKDPKAFDPLVCALKNDDEFPVRFRAAEALAALDMPEAVPVLLEAIGPNGDPSNTVVKYAAEALGSMKLPETVKPMIDILRTRLSRYHKGQDFTAIGGISDGLGKIGSAAVPQLLECLDKREMTPEIIRALEPIGDPSAEPGLLAAASDASLPDYVRSAAVRGIGNMGKASCGAQLSEMLSNTSDDRLIKAIQTTLEKIGYSVDESAVDDAKQKAAKKLLDGLSAIRPGMTEDEADDLVGGAVFGMGANQVHQTPFGNFQLLVNNGIVVSTLWVDAVVEKIDQYLGNTANSQSSGGPTVAKEPTSTPTKATSGIGGFLQRFKRA